MRTSSIFDALPEDPLNSEAPAAEPVARLVARKGTEAAEGSYRATTILPLSLYKELVGEMHRLNAEALARGELKRSTLSSVMAGLIAEGLQRRKRSVRK